MVEIAALLTLGAAQDQGPLLKLEPSDHISIVGNTLADRMQHCGWLETLLFSRFPKHDLVIRNLGFSGDEVAHRLRSAGFASPDDHLAKNKTSVVFAFFGYNESFAADDGLASFRTNLQGYLKHLASGKFDGRSPPRIVLFSPIAHENLKSPNLPDGSANNLRLELYTRAMAEVARSQGVPFVDLFHPTAKLYAESSRPLTINGIHLTEAGEAELARVIDRALFQDPGPVRESAYLERLRAAVLDKNQIWFNRYRTTDGYSIFGGRADLKFTAGQTNRLVMQREMEVLDVMTANRDRKIWASAEGRDLAVDDGNTPEFIPVKTNRPGTGPNGEHVFLGGSEAMGRMKIGKGLKVNLFASEATFPDLVKPVAMAWDARGRLWVAAWGSYPHWKPKEEMNDKLLILEDTGGTGVADKVTVFADRLHNPTGFEFYNGGVLVAQAPDILFLKDTTGSGRADVRERVLSGMDSADTHHTSNSFVFDPGGALYWQEGTFHHTQVETPYGPPRRCANAGVFRYEPRTQRFDVYVSFPFANPHGHIFDRWGEDFVTDGTTAEMYYGPTFSGHVEFPRKHPKPPLIYKQRTRPCPGTEILTSRHFPDEFQGNLLVANVIGFQGILRYKIVDQGSGFEGIEQEPILSSSDSNFRPSALQVGPDGAIYFADWQNPIIGHMQHNLRDPSRDRTHGRIYRVTAEGRPLLDPPRIAGEPLPRLLELLKEPEDRVRYRVRTELGARKTEEVMAAVNRWTESLDRNDKNFEHHMTEALWLHQSHNVVNERLLKRMLASADWHAQAAAARVLRYWRDRVGSAEDLLKALAADEHPRVRLHAVVALSDFTTASAAVAALQCLKHPRDKFLDFALQETIETLKPFWKSALKEGKLALDPAASEYLSAGVDLSELPKNENAYFALLTRHPLPAQTRRKAVEGLAKMKKTDPLTVLLDAVLRARTGEHAGHVTDELAKLITERPPSDLEKALPRLKAFPVPRVGFAAWIAARASGEEPHRAASGSPETLKEFLDSIVLVSDWRVRSSLFDLVAPHLGPSESPQIRRAALSALEAIPGHDSEKFKALAKGGPAAWKVLGTVDRKFWAKEEAQPLVSALVSFVSGLSPEDRTSPEALDALRVGKLAAELLPGDEARKALISLEALQVDVILIRPVPHQMVFDRRKFQVQAGKPVEIVFENSDIMPHNLVIAAPGALSEVGQLAEQMGQAGQDKNYVPDTPKVLWATKLLPPGDSGKLRFVAPQSAGAYPFLCTFPGHWLVMNGVMEVIQGEIARTSPQIQADAAPPRPFVKMWTLEDLDGDWKSFDRGRSFARGRKLFAEAGCIKCHEMRGEGGKVAPELTKISDKYKGKELLRQILDPSAVIDDKYKIHILSTSDGNVVAGVIVREDAENLYLLANLLEPGETTPVPKRRIKGNKVSALSPMPTGLLTTFQKDEILDLVAYVEAGGDPNHRWFR